MFMKLMIEKQDLCDCILTTNSFVSQFDLIITARYLDV